MQLDIRVQCRVGQEQDRCTESASYGEERKDIPRTPPETGPPETDNPNGDVGNINQGEDEKQDIPRAGPPRWLIVEFAEEQDKVQHQDAGDGHVPFASFFDGAFMAPFLPLVLGFIVGAL